MNAILHLSWGSCVGPQKPRGAATQNRSQATGRALEALGSLSTSYGLRERRDSLPTRTRGFKGVRRSTPLLIRGRTSMPGKKYPISNRAVSGPSEPWMQLASMELAKSLRIVPGRPWPGPWRPSPP
jgi:hypothetical protein